MLNFKSNRSLWYESAIERHAAYAFLARPDVQDIWDQPARVNFTGADGRPHFHTFDYLVLLKNGTRIAVAVKPAEKADRIRDTLERIASQGAAPFADRITLVTERDLPTWLVWNAEFIHSAMRDRADDDDAVVRNLLTDVVASVKISDLVKRSGLAGRALRAIARLIGLGELTLTQRGRIKPQSRVMKVTPNAQAEGGR